MATNNEITASITSAVELGITAAEMVALCDRAMAEMIHSGKPQVSYSIAGRTLSFANLQTLMGVRDYYIKAPSATARRFIVQHAEF
jgi:hypothetical protein